MVTQAETEKDIDLILWSMELAEVYRYQNQKFWEKETAQHQEAIGAYAHAVNSRLPRSESVAEHSWHMAYMVMAIAPRFSQLDQERCLKLVVLHDLLEIKTGDADPLGKDGRGTDTHAFNADRKAEKEKREKEALEIYLQKCSPLIRAEQEELFSDVMQLETAESRFVKAIDRMQPLTYILKRKQGDMHDDHILFTLNYTGQCKSFFPEIASYHDELSQRLLESIAIYRGMDVAKLRENLAL